MPSHTRKIATKASLGCIFVAEYTFIRVYKNIFSFVLYHFLLCFTAAAKYLQYIFMVYDHKICMMDKSCVAGLCRAVVAHMVLVAVFLFLGQHLRLEDGILEDSILD